MPSWELSFVLGLAAFLIAHLCFLGLLLPLARAGRGRTVAVAVLWVGCVALLIWFWPQLRADGMTLPVTAYIAVLGAMVSAALLAVSIFFVPSTTLWKTGNYKRPSAG